MIEQAFIQNLPNDICYDAINKEYGEISFNLTEKCKLTFIIDAPSSVDILLKKYPDESIKALIKINNLIIETKKFDSSLDCGEAYYWLNEKFINIQKNLTMNFKPRN